MDYLRATFAPDSDVTFDDRFETVKTAHVFVLDDLGAETVTPWAQDRLYQIFDYRYTRRLPTIVTTSASCPRWDRASPHRVCLPQAEKGVTPYP